MTARKLCFSIFASRSRCGLPSARPSGASARSWNSGERRVHLMSHTGGEEPNRAQFLGLRQLPSSRLLSVTSSKKQCPVLTSSSSTKGDGA
jgi:hypothetical protein